VPSNLSRTEATEEGKLLIEAISLLVQRQHETESWVDEQIGQAEGRAAATDRRYAELEARLASLEERLARLVLDVEPAVESPPLANATPAMAPPVREPAQVQAADEPERARPVATRQDRFGVVLIGAGAVAVLFAILMQFRFS
jgi:hypothetical protein